MPEDSILNEIFNFDDWAQAERELQRRVTISMGKIFSSDSSPGLIYSLLKSKIELAVKEKITLTSNFRRPSANRAQ